MIEFIILDTTAPTYKELFQPEASLVLFGFFILTWLAETAIVYYFTRKDIALLFWSLGVANWLTYFLGTIIYHSLYPEAQLSTLGYILINLVGLICILMLWFHPEEGEAEKTE
mgnify:CR=1 FL=1